MLVQWENELIVKTNSNADAKLKQLIFVPNLRYFVCNHKDIKFKKVFAISSANKNKVYLEAYNEDETIQWRQVEGIETKQDLIEWYQILSKGKARWSYSYIKYNLAHCAKTWMKGVFTKETGKTYIDKNGRKQKEKHFLLTAPYNELCSENEELYCGLDSTYHSGYSVMNCEPLKIYENVYSYDVKSNHSSIMYYFDFPSKFTKVDEKEFKSYYEQKHYFGLFAIRVKKHHPFLLNFREHYNDLTMTYYGWANDVDFEFFKELVGIEQIRCFKLYDVEMAPLPSYLRNAIEILYGWKEKAAARLKEEPTSINEKIKTLYKLCLEKLYGDTVKKRHYEKSFVWDENKQDVKTQLLPQDWNIVREKLHRNYDMSIGVWTCSYTRLQGLKIEKALKKVGCNHLYSDIDCHKFQGEKGLKVIESFNQSFNNKSTLGKFKFEYCAKEFKTLGLKQYIATYDDEDGNETIEVKMAGANQEIIKNYLESLDNPVEAFSQDFPPEIKPYKTIRKNPDGTFEYEWVSSRDKEE